MKYLFFIFSLTCATSYAADMKGPRAVPGRVLVECSANLSDGTEVVARVQPFKGKGITLRVIENGQTKVWDKNVKKDPTDPRGVIYLGKHASLLIPNLQKPIGGPRYYRAYLNVENQGSILLNCMRGL